MRFPPGGLLHKQGPRGARLRGAPLPHSHNALVATSWPLDMGGGFWVEEAYTQQGRAHIRRLHPDWAARPALMSRAAHAVESKAVVRIEVAVLLFFPLWGITPQAIR